MSHYLKETWWNVETTSIVADHYVCLVRPIKLFIRTGNISIRLKYYIKVVRESSQRSTLHMVDHQ